MAALALLLQGCGGGADGEARLALQLENMPQTGEDSVYELWFGGIDDEAVSLARFESPRGAVSLSLPLDPALREGDALFITLESGERDAREPSDTIILAGTLEQGEARLSVADPLALGTDFVDANGTFRLATPSTDDVTDFDLGLWLYELDRDQPIQSVFLPPLPRGWLYEAWVTGGDEPLSLGKFSDPSRPDSDAGGAASSGSATPLFPGSDFVAPPTLIPGLSAHISIEPRPDRSSAPFDFIVLEDEVIERIRVNQPFENPGEDRRPRGRVRVLGTTLPDGDA